ncbi:hypothetical protein D0817_10665 [Flavobacterium cupreum]|uniref:Uncharacterized protein n=2 Tax=Flavobacterium cupreum TaxID=2133766 RepID=A0A434A7B7_9FLAO|nr:hypothetical protein D0817_10665 [Flavobacterium cupreum]
MTPGLPEIKPPVPSLYPSGSFLAPSATQLPSTGNNYQQRQNEQIMNEVKQQEKLRENAMKEARADIAEMRSVFLRFLERKKQAFTGRLSIKLLQIVLTPLKTIISLSKMLFLKTSLTKMNLTRS